MMAGIFLCEGLAIAVEAMGIPLHSTWFTVDWDQYDIVQSGGYGVVLLIGAAMIGFDALFDLRGLRRHVVWGVCLGLLVTFFTYTLSLILGNGARPFPFFAMQVPLTAYFFWYYGMKVRHDG